MISNEIIHWLLEGDVSVRFQVYRDLLDIDNIDNRKKIETEGWGSRFLSFRKSNGYWGKSFYQPKWTSTHYTILDLKNLNISPGNKAVKETLHHVLKNEKGPDGGIYPIGTIKRCDVCVNGMFLNYACYFKVKENDIRSIVDFLLNEKMSDGGFNCQSNKKGAKHSSLHTTISVLEGIFEYERNGYTYRLKELKHAAVTSHEFILMHRLFRSDKTGVIIHPDFLKLHYPCRWHYDILRAMDYFQHAKINYDARMANAIEVILKKEPIKDSGGWHQNIPVKHILIWSNPVNQAAGTRLGH
jgi:hypothetical protein